MTRPFLLDCDTGIDDAMALLYLASEPTIDFVGISTVSGNVTAEQAATNSLRLLHLIDRLDVPVAVGAMDFLDRPFDGGVPHIHGRNGVGNVEVPPAPVGPVAQSGAELIVEMARRYPGELHLITIGPLTNIALALELEPELPRLVSHVTVMGGAALVPGNVSPVAEANIANDAKASAIVLAADWPITLVGLDVTMQQNLEEPDRVRLLESDRPVAQLMGRILDLYFDFYEPIMGRRCSALHDPLAAAIAVGGIAMDLAPVVRVVVDDTEGPGRGQTICDLRGSYAGYPEQSGAHCAVALRIDTDFAPILMERLLSL
ncbi:nucleoside hydrolase [Nakamurella silvestris]|nr:nucleoside hydrolase [Nakamurella silvestris]